MNFNTYPEFLQFLESNSRTRYSSLSRNHKIFAVTTEDIPIVVDFWFNSDSNDYELFEFQIRISKEHISDGKFFAGRHVNFPRTKEIVKEFLDFYKVGHILEGDNTENLDFRKSLDETFLEIPENIKNTGAKDFFTWASHKGMI